MQPKLEVLFKNHVTCMLIRMISNKNGAKNDSFVRTCNRQNGYQKVTKTQPYARLFMVMMFENNQTTPRIACIMEDSLTHNNLQDLSTNISEDCVMNIGAVVRRHDVKPIEKINS